MFECTPISDFWDLENMFTNKMGCVNIITMDIITNSWSAFEDLVIWSLPIPILWKIKVPTAKKGSFSKSDISVFLINLSHSGSLQSCRNLLHLGHLRICSCERLRPLDQLVRDFLELSPLPAPLYYRNLRCAYHFVFTRYIRIVPETCARTSAVDGNKTR